MRETSGDCARCRKIRTVLRRTTPTSACRWVRESRAQSIEFGMRFACPMRISISPSLARSTRIISRPPSAPLRTEICQTKCCARRATSSRSGSAPAEGQRILLRHRIPTSRTQWKQICETVPRCTSDGEDSFGCDTICRSPAVSWKVGMGRIRDRPQDESGKPKRSLSRELSRSCRLRCPWHVCGVQAAG